jgi:hypothetical protein
MGNRPSNTLFYIFLSLVALFGLYIVGGFLLSDQQDDALESYSREQHQTHLNLPTPA